MRKNKKNNSIGGITNSNYHNQNNSLSFNTSSFLSPGNGNPSAGSGGGAGGGLGSSLSFFKSGKSQSSLQQQQEMSQQKSHFSIR